MDHIKQGQFTVAVAEDEEPMAPKFLTDIQDAEVPGLSVLTDLCCSHQTEEIRRNIDGCLLQVFVAEGEPAMFECRVEPKHDLNLSVRW